MRLLSTQFLLNIRRILSNDEGQDLVEYALVVALIALAATAGMNFLASSISNGFSNTGATLTSSI